MVGHVVSGRGARGRQLHRATHAGLEIRKGLAGRHAILQRRPLRAAAVAVDSGGPGLADYLPRTERNPEGLSESGPDAGRPRYRVPRDAALPPGGLGGTDV